MMHMDKKQHGEIANMFIDRFGVSGSTAVSKTEGGGSIPPTGAKLSTKVDSMTSWCYTVYKIRERRKIC